MTASATITTALSTTASTTAPMVVRIPKPLWQWVQEGNLTHEDTLYVHVSTWDGNVHAWRATVHKGAEFIGRTGACKSPGRALEAANRVWRDHK